MTKFKDLPPQVKEIINRTAAEQAKKHGITLTAARENLAARVTKKETRRYSNGTGH